jgi:hypothetical protein
MKSDLIDITMSRHMETPLAVFVSTTGDTKDAVWLPKSQIEIEHKAGLVIITMPEWLAYDKGLI